MMEGLTSSLDAVQSSGKTWNGMEWNGMEGMEGMRWMMIAFHWGDPPDRRGTKAGSVTGKTAPPTPQGGL